MKKGMNSFGIPEGMKIEDAFKGIKSAGFDGVEFMVWDYTTEEDIDEIAACSKKYGIEVISLVAMKLWNIHLTSEDKKIRTEAMEEIKSLILRAKKVGAGAVLIVPGVVTPDVSYAKAVENCRSAIKELVPFIEEHKIYVCLENVWNKFLTSAYDMRDLIDSIGCEYVKAYFDAGNVLRDGYPEYWIEILGDRIKRLHIKDFDGKIGNITGFVDLFEGDMDWARLMKALRSIGYDGYMTVEVPGNPDNPCKFFNEKSEQLGKIFAM